MVTRRQAARAVTARQGAQVGTQRAEQVDGIAVELGFARRGAQARTPALTQVAIQRDLMRVPVDVHVAARRVAQEGVARHGARVAVDLHDAPIERRTDANELGLVLQHGVRVDGPGERGGDDVLAVVDGRRARRTVFRHEVQPVGQVLSQWSRGIQRGAVKAAGARLQPHRVRRCELRLLGHDVQRATGLAAAIQRRGGALEELHPLDGCDVALRAVSAAGRKAIEQRAPVGVAEAPDGVVVPVAAEVIQARDPADVVHHIRQLLRAQVVHQLSGHHPHRLRCFDQGRVGSGGGRLALRPLVTGAPGALAHRDLLQFSGQLRMRSKRTRQKDGGSKRGAAGGREERGSHHAKKATKDGHRRNVCRTTISHCIA